MDVIEEQQLDFFESKKHGITKTRLIYIFEYKCLCGWSVRTPNEDYGKKVSDDHLTGSR